MSTLEILTNLAEVSEKFPVLMKKIENMETVINELKSNQLPDVMSKHDVANFIQQSTQTAIKLMSEIGCSRIHNQIYITRADFDKYLMSNKGMSKKELERLTDAHLYRLNQKKSKKAV